MKPELELSLMSPVGHKLDAFVPKSFKSTSYYFHQATRDLTSSTLESPISLPIHVFHTSMHGLLLFAKITEHSTSRATDGPKLITTLFNRSIPYFYTLRSGSLKFYRNTPFTPFSWEWYLDSQDHRIDEIYT